MFAIAEVASCGLALDPYAAAFMSEEAFVKVLRRKVFEAPADSPNKRTFSVNISLAFGLDRVLAISNLQDPL